ncbi:hypothetical protein ACFSO0_18620 [Brevibacillus sp. GCM10020057]|uniref:hypothetical protein n=1 Tax=Brevibacillus sp. GCM10020057 TaxID=3317327 RepID=UPI0036337D84
MRVQDSLECLSAATQRAIKVEQANRFAVPEDEDLSARLTDPDFLGRVWEQASEIERKVMRQFVTASTRGFFSKRSWEKAAANDLRHMTVGLTRLRRLGIVMTVRKMWSEIGYLMPLETREQITSYLLPQPSRAFVSLAKTLPYYITAGRGLHLDLFGLLLFIRDNEVPVTQKGAIHRRMSGRMATLLSLSDEHCAGVVLPPLDQEDREGLVLTIALDLALRLRLLQIKGKSVAIRERQVRRWLAQSPPERWRDMYECVTEQYLPHGHFWEAFALMMRQVPLDQWCSLDEQLRMLKEAGFTLPPEADRLIAEQWLHLLTGMGWVQLGMDAEERLYWRWNSLPQLTAEEGWFVDAAGTITIPPLVPLLHVWEISPFCTLHFDGPLIRGEIEAKRLQAYLASGKDEQQVIGRLRAASAHPLPEALVEAIGQWAKTARQIRLEPCFCVRTAHPGFLEEWQGIPDFQPFLTQILSPTEFLIPLSQEAALVALLREYGYEPQVLAHTAEAAGEPEQEAAGTAPDGWFAVERPWDGYAVENTYPDLLEGMRDVAALPKMWTQHFQSYHPQSLRNLLKRASELSLEVEIQLEGAEIQRGLPSDVRIEMGYWTVTLATGSGKARLRLDDIGRVRIVVPDYLYEGV